MSLLSGKAIIRAAESVGEDLSPAGQVLLGMLTGPVALTVDPVGTVVELGQRILNDK